ncbi:DUF1223 domain-containing protein [Oceaniglobus roseus]|uniref:DUF1223 domain-containing protein n=1 Tax=Oceaniglobus roseus TaxID=1737570 RepID=UPI000C7E9CF8|nr:DUF1223 domain-containing protein [Kandeliimicrobium roseum]
MLKWMAAALVALAGTQAMAQAEDQPVVIELFTSQGCSSCPPADDLLTKLAGRDDVIALALHVDYWDYIGWKDVFGDPVHTKRQRGYARAAHSNTVYTPQLIVEGKDHVVGYRPMEVMDLIQKHRDNPDAVQLIATRDGGVILIKAKVVGQVGNRMRVQLAEFTPQETVEIKRGENAGKTIAYSNIVRSWRTVGEWDGAAPLSMAVKPVTDNPAAVIIQEADYGPVVAAARIE